jgi:hypothetical protein
LVILGLLRPYGHRNAPGLIRVALSLITRVP